MVSASFNRDMDSYLTRRSEPHCNQKSLVGRIKCRLDFRTDQMREGWERVRDFFSPFDISSSVIETTKLTIVDAGLTPAHKLWLDVKKRIKLWWSDFKEGKKKEPIDIDPSIIQRDIENTKH